MVEGEQRIGIHSTSIDDEVWEEAMEQVKKNGDESLSAVIEDYLRDYADVDDEMPDEDLFLQNSELSEKQKKIVKELIRTGKSGIEIQKLAGKIKRKGIYDRRDFVKNAVERIDKDKTIPYALHGSKLKALNLRCSCGSEFSVTGLSKDGTCPGCGTILIKLDEPHTSNSVQVIQ